MEIEDQSSSGYPGSVWPPPIQALGPEVVLRSRLGIETAILQRRASLAIVGAWIKAGSEAIACLGATVVAISTGAIGASLGYRYLWPLYVLDSFVVAPVYYIVSIIELVLLMRWLCLGFRTIRLIQGRDKGPSPILAAAAMSIPYLSVIATYPLARILYRKSVPPSRSAAADRGIALIGWYYGLLLVFTVVSAASLRSLWPGVEPLDQYRYELNAFGFGIATIITILKIVYIRRVTARQLSAAALETQSAAESPSERAT